LSPSPARVRGTIAAAVAQPEELRQLRAFHKAMADVNRLRIVRRLAHGEATGIILRAADGGYSERHRPVRADRAFTLRQRAPGPVLPTPPEADGDGIPAPHGRSNRLRARLSQVMYADEQPLPEDDPTPKSLPEP